MFVLTGCESENNTGNASGITLKYEFDGKSYQANFKLSSDDKTTDFDENKPESVTIKNEKENYVLDLYIDAQSSGSCEEHEKTVKEDNTYTETKFGKYDGFTADDNREIFGDIYLDKSDLDSYK